MQTDLAPHLINTTEGQEAQKLLSNCVHCGFCTATCPTYQLLGDELDGPRGRIYLIKQMAEGKQATAKTREHLDRCLTCRNCESTCPSGVQYSHLLEIGRKWAQEQAPSRPVGNKVIRWLLKEGLTRPMLFNSSMRIGRMVRPILPKVLKKKIPKAYQTEAYSHPGAPVALNKTMLTLNGCVQPGMLPNINVATERVMNQLGIKLINASHATCCGAIRLHLSDDDGAKNQMRANIDAWWPIIENGLQDSTQKIEAIVMNASGCGVTVKEYAHLLKNDPQYAEKAKIISDLTKDISEILSDHTQQLIDLLGEQAKSGVVYHPPCTLQHGQQIRGKVEGILRSIGVEVSLCEDSHLCCGSAGTYSILQSTLSNQLRNQKLEKLISACNSNHAPAIVSGNIGCITHLQQDQVPVSHWIELIDNLFSQKYSK